jgi:hypothetical protein
MEHRVKHKALFGNALLAAAGLVGALSFVVACGSSSKGAGASTAMGGAAAMGGASAGGTSTTGNAGAVSSGGATPGGAGAAGAAGAPVTPPDACLTTGGCPAGKWINVTPSSIDLVNGDCSNYGVKTVQADAQHPGELYTLFFCQGIWKSTDYGQTWKGPINTGMNGATVGDCAGGITVPPKNTATPPVLYVSCIRGNGLGFWRSTNGGTDWTNYQVGPMAAGGAAAQQFYPPLVDPYDPNHLLMAGHTVDLLVESKDGGQTWTAVPIDPKMAQMGGTTGILFIDTGSAATTRTTWLWLAAQAGGAIGTWRTTNSGTLWTHVESNEHPAGATQIFQPDTSGVVFMVGLYSAQGWGILRSPDYGQTWTHVGGNKPGTIVFGTTKNVYSMYGWAIGAGGMVDPTLQVAALPATGDFATPGTPAEMVQGPAQAAVTNDGMNNIILVAGYNAGLWRYIEP